MDTNPSVDAHLEALRASVSRLRRLTAERPEGELARSAHPTEWSVADVLSHIGSGAVITRRRLEDGVAGQETPDDFAPGVWEEWNAKGAVAQRDDALAADAELVVAFDATTAEQRAAFRATVGPFDLDFRQFVALRLNEHAFHTWDIEVADDPTATLPDDAAAVVVDNLEFVAGFAARPTGDTRTLSVTTTAPARTFVIALTPEAVRFSAEPGATGAEVTLPAESFARLVYGRLDPAHTPPGVGGDDLDLLRRVFPGF